MKVKRGLFIFCSIAAILAAMSFMSRPATNFTIDFQNFVGSYLLKLDSVTYHNALGQPFTVSKFKYYISDISLGNGQFNSGESFLVNEEDPASKSISLQVPAGVYNQISFTIGVDSLSNCSGAQTGALDPANGMFWAWNTGYVFLKMEGNSPVSKSPGNMLEFHIGGYKQPNNAIRKVRLRFKSLTATDGGSIGILIQADLLKLFKGTTTVDFSKTSSITDFHGATSIADNYKDMFTIMQE